MVLENRSQLHSHALLAKSVLKFKRWLAIGVAEIQQIGLNLQTMGHIVCYRSRRRTRVHQLRNGSRNSAGLMAFGPRRLADDGRQIECYQICECKKLQKPYSYPHPTRKAVVIFVSSKRTSPVGMYDIISYLKTGL